MSDKNRLLLKIAHHYGELAQLYTLLAASNGTAPKPAPKEEARAEAPQEFICKHNLPAKRIDGVAKTGKNAGQPYIMHVCPKDRSEACDYRVFEDVKELAKREYVDVSHDDDDIPF